MAHLTQNPADKERFVCLYPIYINSKKTLAEGRRISVEKAVENPSCTEIRDVLAAAGMNVYMERTRCAPDRLTCPSLTSTRSFVPDGRGAHGPDPGSGGLRAAGRAAAVRGAAAGRGCGEAPGSDVTLRPGARAGATVPGCYRR
uniref:Signal recognition particle 19 kDa protein n=1 Tax=Neolamprologus brichardi TaxID=32507 RepID=A0A3Q4G4W2_NEOBR